MILLECNAESPAVIFEQIAIIHMTEVPRGFLTKLGKGFLSRFYYCVAKSDNANLIAAFEEEKKEVIGFIALTKDIRKLRSDLLQPKGGLVCSGTIINLVIKALSPKRIFGIIETLLYPSKNKDSRVSYAEIINFCILKCYARQGLGYKLFREATNRLKSQNVTKLQIITGANQISAQTFYEKNGAIKLSEVSTHKDVKSFSYVYNIY